MLNLTELEKAYLAGLFGGEGSVGYYYKSATGYHAAQVQISNSSPEIIEWLRERIPFGSIAVTNNKKCKYTNWSWICNSRLKVKEFLETIRPYLVFKSKQVDLLFSLWDAEQKIGCGAGVKLSEDTVKLRQYTEAQLKLLKTSSFESIQ